MTKPGTRNIETYHKVKAALPPELHDTLDDLCEELESDFEDAKTEHDEAINCAAEDAIAITETLEHIKYWMLDVLVHHRPMTDPRAILRRIEETI